MADYQLALVDDPSDSKAFLAGRRSGKTVVDAAYAVTTALRFPGSLTEYITTTAKNARLLLGPQLNKLKRKHGLEVKFDRADNIYRFSNGSWIWLGGANDAADIEKYRGFAPHLVIIDECASVGSHFDALVEEVIDPSLLDNRGTKLLTGSPGPICAGGFYEATTDPLKGYSVHRANCLKNPFLPHAAAWLEKKRKKHGWSKDHPRYLREWMGLWIPDGNSLVYRYNSEKSHYSELPTHHAWEYVLGVDFGHTAASAFVVLAFARTCPDVYLLECWQKTKMDVTDVRQRIEWYMGQRRFTRIVGDPGGLGVTFIDEFRRRNSIPIIAAEKQHKPDFIELMNGDLATGRLKVPKDSPVALEWAQLQWDDDRKKEDKRYPNHLSDAALYAWREAKHYAYTPVDPPPTSPIEALNKQAQEIEQRAKQRIRDKRERAFWE